MSDEDREIPLTLSTGNFGQSQARARQVVSPAPDKTGSPASRRLQVVLVMDLKVQKNLRSRELAANDVQKVTDQLNVQLTKLEFDRLDFGETNTLDTFYSADVALVDVSVPQQQASLCYHIGVRESMGQNYNLILTLLDETDNKLETLKQTLRHQILVYFTTPDSAHLMSTEKKEGVDFGESTNLTKSDCIRGKIVQFKHRLKMALKNVQVEANAHSREKFLSDIRKVREITDVSEANAFLDKMRIRLDNPDVLSVDTVHQLLLGYRDKQNYEGMISLIDELKKVPGCGVLQAQAIRFLYAFALNRRNKGNDRDRSLETVLKIMTDAEKVKDGKDPKDALSPDMICLAGRIYKDKFCASGYEDKSSLDSAIQWYRKAFELSPLEYSGINLATLLRASGETFENNPEMSRIGLVLNSLLGRKGALQSLQDYWDVATFFEVSVLAEDYSKACQAALRMSQLKPPVWHLRSTMENIKLINRCAATMSPIEKDKQQFLFWTEFFMEATESETAPIHCARFPVLIQELKQFTPSFLTMNVQEGSIILSHVLENSQQKKPPPGIHRWHFTSGNIKAVSRSKRDDRSLFLYVHENSDDFNLVFPSAPHCNKVISALEEMTQGAEGNSGKVLNDIDYGQMQFEYETDKQGNRVNLGSGTYGTVYAARDLTTQRQIVVKEIEVKFDEEVQPLMEEIQLHSTLLHQNIVQYLGCDLLKRDTGNDVFLIFMEHVPGGSLSNLLRQKWGALNEQNMVNYGRQILAGLKYLHEQKIVHRDIKGDNVLVNTYSGICKISDFGTCKRLAGLNPNTASFTGTLVYMAPEVIDHGQRGYGAPADIWSFGCTCVEMVTGKPPFLELLSPEAALFRVGMFKCHPPIPEERLSERCVQFIKSCFEPEAMLRPTASKLYDEIGDILKRAGSISKKPPTDSKHKGEFARSTSHIGGMGIEKKTEEDGGNGDGIQQTYTTQTQPKTRTISTTTKDEKKLHLKIEHPRLDGGNRTYSASPVDPPSVCSSPNPMFLPFSQPNSPISDDIQQPQLVTSPGSVLSTPMSVGHGPLLNRTISDETGHQRFFMLKKDSERRHYLARFMNEEKDEIVNIWFTQLMHTAKSSPCVTRNMLMTLLMGMKDYLVYKNNEKIQDALNEIRHQLDYEPTSVSQINLALCTPSPLFWLVLRKQIIKPHWMFALDYLIRSAVQAAVQILSPDLSAVLQVHDVAATPSSTATGQRPSVSRDSAVSEGDATDSRPPSAPPAFESTVVREKRENIRGVHDDNKQLFDHLLEVEKELNTLLQIIITDKKRKIANLKEFTERPELMISQLPSLSTLPNGLTNGGSTQSIQPISNGSSPRTSVPRSTEEVVSWLRSLDVDDHSIQCVLREGYSKSDLLEYVTREELRQCGVSGGSSCRIFRACQEVRDRSRRGQAFLSAPLLRRDDSLDDYHSSIAADEMGNPDHFHH
ncbi:unnamed protein product, partial [Mesorhabditis belari]|uniref:mitogen-activated protein kinase kinase kinase n=1 Tax=Mesorhabditis belari TaxID=2138241 RepID=A0AAF3EM34_9BILA